MGLLMRHSSLIVVLLVSGLDAQFETAAPFASEERAAQRAAALGVGHAEIIGPDSAVVGTYSQFRLRFTVGQAGLARGGAIRILSQHGFTWDMWGGIFLQNRNPKAVNYLSYRTSTGAPLHWKGYPQYGPESLSEQYFPWESANELTLVGEALDQGDWIEVVFGDRSQGSPGVQMQLIDETAFEQRVFAYSFGQGEFLPLPEVPSIQVLAGTGRDLKVIAASDWDVGKPGWVNVWVDDGFGNPAESYRGNVTLEAISGGACARRSFSEADRGAYRFEELTLSRPGVVRFRARDDEGLEAISNPVRVHRVMPQEKIYWGDLHTHTKYSDGRGTPEEMYDFGKRIAAIDFCAVSDHAFITTDWMWEEIVETTNRLNEPGRFVTFVGFEWSGPSDVGGDHNVYTVNNSLPLMRSYLRYNYRNLRNYHGAGKQAGHVEDLFRMLGAEYRDENILVIPHYGGRPGNPEWHNSQLQRQIEVFSDHRRSENWVSTYLEKDTVSGSWPPRTTTRGTRDMACEGRIVTPARTGQPSRSSARPSAAPRWLLFWRMG